MRKLKDPDNSELTKSKESNGDLYANVIIQNRSRKEGEEDVQPKSR